MILGIFGQEVAELRHGMWYYRGVGTVFHIYLHGGLERELNTRCNLHSVFYGVLIVYLECCRLVASATKVTAPLPAQPPKRVFACHVSYSKRGWPVGDAISTRL